MTNFKTLAATLALLASATFADQWIGGGQGGLASATVKSVRVQFSGLAFFVLNESSAYAPAGRIWQFNHTTATGKSVLAALLAAKAANSPIQFMETSYAGTTGQYYFENLTFGNSLP